MSISENCFVREFESKRSYTLTINQCEIGDVGCVVWDAALVLATYLETDDFTLNDSTSFLAGKKVIELGSGTGIVGIQAAAVGANVTITDLEDFLPLMQLNIKTNEQQIKGKIDAQTLKWGTSVDHINPKPDIILMADCIYYEESLKPLIQTLCDLCGPNSFVLCCYEARTQGKNPETEKIFFKLIKEHFTVEEIPMERQDPVYRCEEIHVLKFRKKKFTKQNK